MLYISMLSQEPDTLVLKRQGSVAGRLLVRTRHRHAASVYTLGMSPARLEECRVHRVRTTTAGQQRASVSRACSPTSPSMADALGGRTGLATQLPSRTWTATESPVGASCLCSPTQLPPRHCSLTGVHRAISHRDSLTLGEFVVAGRTVLFLRGLPLPATDMRTNMVACKEIVTAVRTCGQRTTWLGLCSSGVEW